MISYYEALDILRKNAAKIAAQQIDILSALGHYCAIDIIAPISIPSFDNSAMDGFGVKVEWLVSASAESPVAIPKAHAIGAGEINEDQGFFTPHIMTGAKTPNWVEAVVPIENTREKDGKILFAAPVKLGQNIRKIGTDIAQGVTIIKAGQKLNPEHIAILAALGIAKVSVSILPELMIYSTGNEIIAHDSGPLKGGQIYNSNAPYLLTRAKEIGLCAKFGGKINDDKDEFIRNIQTRPEKSLIITTGAVSMGKYDFIPLALAELGATIHFHKCNIRPGKPILFATLPNGTLFFGLPGNPISSAIGFNFFVLPMLGFMLGIESNTNQIAILENNFSKAANFRQFVKAKLKTDQATNKIEILEGQESYKILPMVKANAWAILTEDKNEFKAGEMVEFIAYGAGL